MNYRMTDEMSNKAMLVIENDEIIERVKVLNGQIEFLDSKSKNDKVVFGDNEYSQIKESLEKLNDTFNVLNFKKDNLNISLNNFLEKINISDAIKVKQEISKIDEELSKVVSCKNELLAKIKDSEIDYDNQMLKIREKYKDVDIIKNNINDNEFSLNVINDYKREYATNLVNQFLDSLPDSKQKEVMDNNPNLKGYVDVGEDI